MAAANTDLFKKLANNFSTTLSGAIVGAGDSSMSLGSSTNLATDTGIVLVIDRVNASGVVTPTLREYVVGTVSGTTIINLIRGVGNSTAQAHLSGAIVEQVVDQTTINDIITGIRAQHNQDGSHAAITASSVSATGIINASSVSSLQDASTALSTYRKEYTVPFVASGGIWTGDSYGGSLNASMTAIVCYVNGQRLSVNAITARGFTANKDTYVDILNTAGVGSVVYTEVANGATSPALAANSIRIAKIISGTTITAATSVVQYGLDTVTTSGQLNFIYNTSPNAVPISTYVNGGTAGGTYYYRNQNGIKELWGITANNSVTSTPATFGFNTPSNFFNGIFSANIGVFQVGSQQAQYAILQGMAFSGGTITQWANSAGTQQASLYIRGY